MHPIHWSRRVLAPLVALALAACTQDPAAPAPGRPLIAATVRPGGPRRYTSPSAGRVLTTTTDDGTI